MTKVMMNATVTTGTERAECFIADTS